MKFGIIGCGKMGSVILESILSLKSVNHRNVMISDIDETKLRHYEKKYKILISKSNCNLTKFSDLIILAVKPQQIKEVLDEIKSFVTPRKIVVSIAAGVKISTIEKVLGKNVPIVRTMPNLPLKVGCGITAVCYNSTAKNNSRIKSLTKRIFSVKGEIVEIKENKMDLITAISGSGPAYLFYISEILQYCGVRFGLAKNVSEKLVNQTLHGAAVMLSESGISAEQLRKDVTSKGGTTEYALKTFYKYNLKKIFYKAIQAAKNRAKELSKMV